ncbi:hypothetical protein [Xanthomonas oryzae]|uniref:hypothetical protein n=1 Tax=Xanthomonas oryzae TaxID=347 RepID=UPI00215BAC04|nr:hypothetical protein [Xanthomonas oryzae]
MDACPGAAKFIQAQISRQLAAAPPKAPVVTDEAKRHRLLEHEEEDQRLYEQLASGGVNPTTLKELQARNLRYLHKELGHAVSIPSIDEVGRDAEVSPHFFLRDQALVASRRGRRCAHGARFKVTKPEKSANHARQRSIAEVPV